MTAEGWRSLSSSRDYMFVPVGDTLLLLTLQTQRGPVVRTL